MEIVQIRMYEPVSLIVGTRGRNLSGVHGLLPGSVSKYCLQHSPIPVVVVRPSPKREKKKNKRLADPTRRTYNQIREMSERHGGGRLLDSSSSANSSVSRLPDEEAAVAEALGLPAFNYSGSSRPSSVSTELTTADESDSPPAWNPLNDAAAQIADQTTTARPRSPIPAESLDADNDNRLTPVSTNESGSTVGPDRPTDEGNESSLELSSTNTRVPYGKADETFERQKPEQQVELPIITKEDTRTPEDEGEKSDQ